jgi:enoyl-CoA hydratase/carnithine racemase
MTAYENLLYEKQRNGLLITLNRPEAMNALSQGLRNEIDAALEEARQDPDIRAVVITGAGRAFSAGADIGGGGGGTGTEWAWPYGIPEGASLTEHYGDWRDRDRSNIESQLYRWEYPKPIIGAISGWCLGAGSWLALTCHMTIAADDAVFGQPEVRMASNSNFMWVLLAGAKNALRYALTGDHLDAQEALRIGIVNKVVPKEDLLDECFSIVERIALVPPETVKINLAVATMGLEMMGLRKALNLNAELSAMAHVSKREEFNKHLEDARKEGGLRAFLQARDTPFMPEPFGPRAKGE